MKKIMILGASILQVPAIKKAIELGLQVVVVDMNQNAIGFKVDGIEKEIISTIDTDAVLGAAKRHSIDGIMTLASDVPMQTVAKVAKELSLYGISEATALKATNKMEMRKALEKFKVPIPIYFQVNNINEFKKAVENILSLNTKCIVKPVDNSGSRGICLISDTDDDSLETVFNYSKEFSRNGMLLVEEYMEGPEVSVETITYNGICNVIQITDKITTGSPYFVEMGHSQPSALPEFDKERIMKVAIEANKAVGIDCGPSHTEIIVTEDGPKVVELGARLGGDNITTHLVPLSTGIDMVECCIKIALGDKPDFNNKFSKASAIRYFPECEGMIKNIYGINEARCIEGVKEVTVVHGVGEYAQKIKNSVDRTGYVISQGKNVQQAIKICDNACNKITFETEV